MSSTTNVVLTLAYDMELTRSYTIEDVPTSAISSIRSKVNAINANAGNQYDAFYATFINYYDDEVNPVRRISEAKIVAVQEDVIYNG